MSERLRNEASAAIHRRSWQIEGVRSDVERVNHDHIHSKLRVEYLEKIGTIMPSRLHREKRMQSKT